MPLIVGIDPGVKGAFGVADTEGAGVFTWEPLAETVEETHRLWSQYSAHIDQVFIESISPRPQQDLKSVVTSCVRFGWLQMLTRGLEVQYITPQKWQASLGLSVKWGARPRNMTEEAWASYKYNERKKMHRKKAKELFPNIDVTHRNADALLITKYGLKIWGRENG